MNIHPLAYADPGFRSWLARRAWEAQGRWGECLAALGLQLKGYRILARRYKTRSGELDLVARRGATVAFVEVKVRSSQTALDGAITPRQSRRMRRAAALWVARYPRYEAMEQRFDAVYIVSGGWPRHLPGAA